MTHTLFTIVAITMVLSLAGMAIPQPVAEVDVQPDTVTGRIDQRIYGHFLEHIYHSVEDGLFGELVRNRAFAAPTGIVREGGRLTLSSPATDVKTVFGDPNWTDYEFTLKARKTSGAEGFLILIRATDDRNFYWWNLGGWGNTAHQLEVEKDDNRHPIGPRVPGRMETGRWYAIRMRVEADHIQGWVDDQLILDMRDGTHPRGGVGVGFWATCGEYTDFHVRDLSGHELPLDLGKISAEKDLPAEWKTWPAPSVDVHLARLADSPNTGLAAQIRLQGAGAPVGIAQERFNVVRGHTYQGTVWMKADNAVGSVTVAFVDSTGRTLCRQRLSAPTAQLRGHSIALRPTRTDRNATLVLEATGSGVLWVDMVSLTRDDYVATGCRTDLLQAVQALHPPIIRWPGGCFASIYRWKRAIGPQHDRKPFHNYVWGEWDSCGFGIDEYIRLCRIVGAEPMVVVNLGSWDDPAKEDEYVREALEWIEYCNGDASTPMGALRAANGHPEPYNVVHWEMDNETWALGVERYGRLVAKVARQIRQRWPGLKIHACTFWEKEDPRLLELCGQYIDYISYHFYEDPNRYATAPGFYENLWKRYAGIIARSPNPRVRISVTEWNAQSTDWRTGLFAAGYLNVMERSTDVVEIATPALFLRRVDAPAWDNAFINHDHVSWYPAPNYVVMKLYRDRFQPFRVACTAPAGLDVTATRSADGKQVVVKIVNASGQSRNAQVSFASPFALRTAEAQQVAARLEDRNTLAEPHHIAPARVPVSRSGNRLNVQVPPLSVTVLTVKGTGLRSVTEAKKPHQ